MTRTRMLTTVAVTAILTAGCGTDDTEDQADRPVGETAEEQVDATGDDDTTTDEGGAPPRTDLTGQDGFNGPLDVDADHEPGTGMVTFGGEEIALDVECRNPDADPDRLFHLWAVGEGEDADGNELTAQAERDILREPDQFYDYGGQEEARFSVGLFVGDLYNASAVASPADADPTGANLPIVRVMEDGHFSAVAQMRAASTMEHAPDGEVVFTGRCQEGWNPIVDSS
jgi:hypothetical protein